VLQIIAEARSRLGHHAQNPQLLAYLILQGLEKLTDEPTVLVKCRKQDVQALQQAITMVKSVRKTDVTIMKDFLPDIFEGERISGGLLLMNVSGKIKVNNTFEARLSIAAAHQLPEIKAELFPNSKQIMAKLGKDLNA